MKTKTFNRRGRHGDYSGWFWRAWLWMWRVQ